MPSGHMEPQIPAELKAHLEVTVEGGSRHIKCRYRDRLGRECGALFFTLQDAVRHLATHDDRYRRFLRDPGDEAARIFSLFGRFEARGGRILYSSRGPPVEIPRASAMAAEVLGIMLPIYASRRDSLILIEEPEAQLHPAAHVLMAVALLAVAGLGYRLVVTTHSEQLVATIAGVASNSAGVDGLASLVDRAAELTHVSVDRGVARYVATMALSAAERGVEFYYLDGAGARRVDKRDIAEKEYSIQYVLDSELSKILPSV